MNSILASPLGFLASVDDLIRRNQNVRRNHQDVPLHVEHLAEILHVGVNYRRAPVPNKSIRMPGTTRVLILPTGRGMFDRDTATGAEPEEVMGIEAPTLIIPGDDPSHATSAAHYLRELMAKAEFWNVMPPEQTTQKVCDRVLGFCRKYH
jgi:hypothetical protein